MATSQQFASSCLQYVVCFVVHSTCVQEQVPHAVDVSGFHFKTDHEPSNDVHHYRGNSSTESARWKSLEPHQQAYVSCAEASICKTHCGHFRRNDIFQVNQQIDKAVDRIIELLQTPRGWLRMLLGFVLNICRMCM